MVSSPSYLLVFSPLTLVLVEAIGGDLGTRRSLEMSIFGTGVGLRSEVELLVS